MPAQPAGTAEPPTSHLALVVEDDPDLLRLLRMTLERGGFEVLTAADGRDALARLIEVAVDVIVTDLSMPSMDGCEFIRSHRRLGGSQPVLVLTGLQSDDPLVRSVIAEGRVVVAYKPPVFRELPSILRSLLV